MLKRKFCLGLCFTGLLMLFGSLLAAQSSDTILTIALNEWQMDMINDRVLQEFYDTHPGVKVVTVALTNDETSYFGLDTSDIADSLDRAEHYFSSADIVMATQYNMNPLVTRAGYALDLTPYIRADGSGDIDDFYPIGRKTFEWDNGQWALPASLRINFMSYNAAAFDEAGYPHPDSTWGLNDYLDAARALTIRDDDGIVTRPGFYGFDERMLIGALLGRGFYDSSTQPETPAFADPELADMVEAIGVYNDEIMGDDPENMPMSSWDWNEVPIQTGGTWRIAEDNPNRHEFVLFPNETAVVSSEGFAISAGTPDPDLAYELVMYLTGNIEVVTRFFGDVPARQSLEGQTAENFGVMPPPKAFAEILPTLLENSIPASEMRYGDYIYAARTLMEEDSTLTMTDALQQAQEQAIADLELAAKRQETVVLMVATPVPTPMLSADEVALKFLLQSNYSPLPNRDEWEQVALDFTDTDPQVGYVELITNSQNPQEDYKVVDCAYTPYNTISWIDLELIQPIEPFLSTDSAFDRSDYPVGLWPAVTRDEMIYGLPLTVTPIMMWYNPNDFEAAGAFTPQNGWTVGDFMDALETLKIERPSVTPYSTQNWGNTAYVLLAAAMGGVPIDYSTYMPTYHLTDPEVVEALRQTLDLAKNGYIDYVELGGEQSMFGGGQTAIYDSSGGVYDWDDMGTEWNPYLPVTFPRGTDTIPMAYGVGAAFITSQTPYADACYRWLSTLAQHPELFNEMPARRSFATSEDIISQRGQSASDFYTTMFDMFDSPEAIFVPAGVGAGDSSTGAYTAEIWFNQAMDAYVLEDRDLETALADAQTRIEEYSACIADIPRYDASLGYTDGQWEDYYKQFTDCAISVDPSMASRFEPQDE